MKAFFGLAVLGVAFWVTPVWSQVGWAGYGFGTRAGMLPPTPWMMGGVGGIGGRGGLYSANPYLGGYGGPRAVTWYTPGQGYATNLPTGLPWNGSATGRGVRAYNPTSLSDGSTIARQDRAKRRLETLYAVKQYDRQRQEEYAERAMLAASAKKKTSETSKTGTMSVQKERRPKSKTAPSAAVVDQPTRPVPTEKLRSAPADQPTVTSPAGGPAATTPAK